MLKIGDKALIKGCEHHGEVTVTHMDQEKMLIIAKNNSIEYCGREIEFIKIYDEIEEEKVKMGKLKVGDIVKIDIDKAKEHYSKCDTYYEVLRIEGNIFIGNENECFYTKENWLIKQRKKDRIKELERRIKDLEAIDILANNKIKQLEKRVCEINNADITVEMERKILELMYDNLDGILNTMSANIGNVMEKADNNELAINKMNNIRIKNIEERIIADANKYSSIKEEIDTLRHGRLPKLKKELKKELDEINMKLTMIEHEFGLQGYKIIENEGKINKLEKLASLTELHIPPEEGILFTDKLCDIEEIKLRKDIKLEKDEIEYIYMILKCVTGANSILKPGEEYKKIINKLEMMMEDKNR